MPEIEDKTEFNFEQIRVENPMEQQSWAEFTRSLNTMNKDVDFAKVRTGAGSNVDFGHVTAVSITANEIKANTITANEIAAGTITANEITAGTITANEISANTITANEMNVNQLSAISADIGSITAGSLDAVTITGTTITGSTLQTDTSGLRVEIGVNTTSQVAFYDSNGTSAGALESETISGSPVMTLSSSSSTFFQMGIFTGEASDIRMMTGGLAGTGVKAYSSSGLVKIYGDLEPASSSSNLGSSSIPWDNLYIEDIYSPTERVLDVNESPAPQWTVPMGLKFLASPPGSASTYEGYVYYDTTKANIVYSGGNQWLEVQASGY